MKATGIVRRVDDLGRVVIPKEIRNTRGIAEGDSLEIYVDGNDVIFRKYNPGCAFCGSVEQLFDVDGIRVCRSCAQKIAEVANER